MTGPANTAGGGVVAGMSHNTLPRNFHGMLNNLDFALAFRAWAESAREVTAEAIAHQFDCSRATSYRYLAAWNNHKSRIAS